MSSRRAKVARVILIATPDNSSSKEGDDEEEEAGNEIQVEFEAIGPEEEEDFQGIRRLLQQFFVRNTDFVSTNLFRTLTLDDPKKMIIQFQI